MTPVYLVIAARGVGGAEKRLAEIWLELARRGLPMRMIVPAETYHQLLERPDLAGLGDFRDRILRFTPRRGSLIGMMRGLIPVIRQQPRGAIFHHILMMPPLIHPWRGDRTLLTWAANLLPQPRASKSALADWFVSRRSIAAADRVDVLNPDVAAMLRASPSLASKLSVTAGGTFVDFNQFSPAPIKRSEVVFLGRIEWRKNALAFVEALPAIAGRLEAAGRSASLSLYGAPSDQSRAVAELLARPSHRGLDVTIGKTSDPASVLAPAKLFVSLQNPSNYPSKSLAEAMACGCVPVINDSGESRLMADPDLARFIPADFTTAELADAVVELLLLDEQRFAERSAAVRADAMARFSITPQADYFAALYARMAAGAA